MKDAECQDQVSWLYNSVFLAKWCHITASSFQINKRRTGECGPYLLIKQLKTLALKVTQRNSYLCIVYS